MIHTISKQKEMPTMSNARSAISPTSIILCSPLLHSTKASRFILPLTTVIGPFAPFKVVLHKRTLTWVKGDGPDAGVSARRYYTHIPIIMDILMLPTCRRVPIHRRICRSTYTSTTSP